MTLEIQHNVARSQFQYLENQQLCYLDYTTHNNVMSINHTTVPKELGGKGIAAALTEAALLFARENRLQVKPVCSYTATYFKRHPEYQDLLSA